MVSIVFILHFLGEAFWFYLPVFIANILIYVVYSIIKLDIPLDLYGKIGRRRIIGQGRNVAGFFFFVFTAVLVGILQERAIEALYLGIGGIFGCYLSSFIKRRMNLKHGDYSFFIDQTDFILGSSLFYVTQFELEWKVFIGGIIISLILHHSVNLLRKSWEILVQKYICPHSKLV